MPSHDELFLQPDDQPETCGHLLSQEQSDHYFALWRAGGLDLEETIALLDRFYGCWPRTRLEIRRARREGTRELARWSRWLEAFRQPTGEVAPEVHEPLLQTVLALRHQQEEP
jgi:hypothetical protein